MRLEDLDGLSQDQQFAAAAKNAGVSESTLRNIWTAESGNGQNMGPSSAGAEGHFQQMPGIRKTLEARAGRSLDPYNFQQGLYMASELLKENMQHFGSEAKAVAAYNGGWTPEKWDNPETRAYVDKVLGSGAGVSAGIFNVRPDDVRSAVNDAQFERALNKEVTPDQRKQTPNEKAAIATAISHELSNGTPMTEVAKLQESARGMPEKFVDQAIVAGTQPAQPDYTTADTVIQRQLDADKARAEEAANRGYGETLEAALNEYSVTQNLWRQISLSTARDTDAARVDDREWQKHYIANRPELTKGMSASAILELDGARNQHEYDTIVADEKEQQRYQQVLQDSEHPLLWGIAGTVLDPISLAAGVATDGIFTAGRTAAVAGALARSAEGTIATSAVRAASGTLGQSLARGAVTGAVTNLEVTGMLDVLGKQTTVQDYMFAAAAGLGLGLLGGAVHYGLTKGDRGQVHDLMDDANRRAAQELVDDIEFAADTGLAPDFVHANRTAARAAAKVVVKGADEEVATVAPESTGRRATRLEVKVARQDIYNSVFQLRAIEDEIADINARTPTGSNKAAREYFESVKPHLDLLKSRQDYYRALRDSAEDVLEQHQRWRANNAVTPTAEDAVRAKAQSTQDALTDTEQLNEPVPESQVPFGKAAQEDFAAQAQPQTVIPEPTSDKPIGKNRPDAEADKAAQEQQGIDLITDPERLNSVTGLYRDADMFWGENPDAVFRLNKLAGAVNTRKYIGVQSTGSIMRMDENPLVRMLGVLIAEDAAGESGIRVMTAAIDSKVRHAAYMNGFEHGMWTNYQDWLRARGFNQAVGAIETFTTGNLWERFMVEVATEIRGRGKEEWKSTAHGSVIRAANRAELGFKMMGDDQRLNRTLGSEFIPESSVGYLPQQLNGAMFNKLSLTERQRVIAEFERQAKEDLGWDAEFAGQKVREYIKRAEDYATQVGGRTPPSPKSLKEIALEDLHADYAAGKLSQEQFYAGVERLRKGAAKHTGKRIDWDLTQLIQRDDGSLMSLSDLYVNDVVELYRSYANRAAGDVALARKGILGDRDIDLITEAIRSSKVGNPLETVPAWNQIIAEIYNRPVSRDAHEATGKILRPIRQFTNLRLLGGVVFPQMAETANMVAHLGVMNTLNIIQKFPRLAGELAMIKRGEIPQNSILASIDRVMGSPLGGEEWQFVLPRVFDENTGILDGYSIGTINRLIAGGQLIHQKFSFMRMATTIQKRFVGEEIVAKSLRYMRDGMEDAALRDMGFSPEMSAFLREHMDEFAKFDDRGYVVAFDAAMIPDQYRDDYIAAVVRGTNQIIQGTFPGETGKWMRTELTQTLFQLRRFPATAVEKQMLRQFRNFGATRALGGIAAGMGLGALIYMGRAQVAASLMPEDQRRDYLEKRLSIGAIAGGATTYVSALGLSSDVALLFGGVAHKVNDSYDLGVWNSRGVPAQGLGSVIPALGTGDDIYNLIQNPSSKAALSILPFANLPFVLPMLNHLKATADEED